MLIFLSCLPPFPLPPFSKRHWFSRDHSLLCGANTQGHAHTLCHHRNAPKRTTYCTARQWIWRKGKRKSERIQPARIWSPNKVSWRHGVRQVYWHIENKAKLGSLKRNNCATDYKLHLPCWAEIANLKTVHFHLKTHSSLPAAVYYSLNWNLSRFNWSQLPSPNFYARNTMQTTHIPCFSFFLHAKIKHSGC